MQIIEDIRINRPSHDYYPHEAIPQKVCDDVNFYNPEQILRYLEGFNEACKADNRVIAVSILIEYSPDPIGSLTKCPAMGGYYRGMIYLGDVVSVIEHLYIVSRVRFIGYHEKPTNEIIPVDFYSKT